MEEELAKIQVKRITPSKEDGARPCLARPPICEVSEPPHATRRSAGLKGMPMDRNAAVSLATTSLPRTPMPKISITAG